MTAFPERSALAHDVPSVSRAHTDAELVAQCLARNAVAERMLYGRHLDALYRVAFRLCGDADMAADITQEAFVQAFARLGQFRGESALRTWLISILVSAAGKAMRKGRWLSSRRIDLDDAIPAPPRAASEIDVASHIDAALAGLSSKLRVAVVMHDLEGFTHQEIASALDIPVGTSKARLSKARAKLRVVLAHHWEDRTS